MIRIKFDASLTATRNDVARISESMAATKNDMARIDAVLDSIQKNHATKTDLIHLDTRLAKMELRLMRWMLATMIGVIGISSSVVFLVVKLTQ